MNNHIFSDLQLSSILLGLEKGDIPLKYTYITPEGAKARSKIEKLRIQKGQSFADAALLKDSIELYLQELNNPKELAIFDFGCGTGETVKETLQKLSLMGIHVRYHAFDISQSIINLCKQNISKIKNCTFDYSIIDFEISNLVNILYDIRLKYNNIPVLGLLLGNTVGNFSSMERILTNILEACRIGDRLVVGIERADIQNQRRYEKMIRSYQTKEIFDQVGSTAKTIGFDVQEKMYDVSFNEKISSIEIFITIPKSTTIKIKNTLITFQKSEKIRVAQSKKINELEFSRLFLDLDLRIANIRTNETNSYLQALISSKKH